MPQNQPPPEQGENSKSCLLSELPLTIFVSISSGFGDYSDLIHATGRCAEDLQPVLVYLQKSWLIEKNNECYRISQSGKLVLRQLRRFIAAVVSHKPAEKYHEPFLAPVEQITVSSDLSLFLDHRSIVLAQIRNCRGVTVGKSFKTASFGLENGPDPAPANQIDSVRPGDQPVVAINPGYSGVPDSESMPLPEILRTFFDLQYTISVISKYAGFFEMHSLEGIPDFALDGIGDLNSAELVSEIPVDFQQGLETYFSIINKAEYIHGVSAFALPSIADAIGERVMEGKEVTLIVTKEIVRQMFKKPYRERAQKLGSYPNLQFRVSNVPIKMGLTVTDKSLSFGLFTRDKKTYDSIYDLVCHTGKALSWGENLFRYYVENSVSLEEFLQNPKNFIWVIHPFR